MRTTSLITVAALFLGSCNYEPPLRGKDDRWRRDDHSNTIRGSIHLIGPTAEEMELARAMILVFDADNPGPPEGTSGPVDFAVVGEFDWAGSEDFGWTAEWAATDLADGEYVFDAIIDLDGDFQPLMFTLGGATCGDYQGSHFGINTWVDPSTGTTTGTGTTTTTTEPEPTGPTPVYGKGRVRIGFDEDGENDPIGQVVWGVDILAEQRLDTERPAFVVAGEKGWTRISLNEVGTAPLPPEFNLRSKGVHVSFVEDGETIEPALELADACPTDDDFTCNADTVDCAGAFSLYYPDKDGNGRIDFHPDYPEDFGLKDVWPRVYLAYKGAPVLDGNGDPLRDEVTGYPVYESLQDADADGFSWGTEAFTFGVLAAGFNLPVTAQAVGQPLRVNNIDVMFPPLVAKFYDEWNVDDCGEIPEGTDPSEGCTALFDLSDPEQRAQVPNGIWEINVIGWNGQTWGIPNEISEMGLPGSPGHEDYDVRGQGGFVYVVP